ncbi:MAG: Spy/CpxP family protein refolding chaperone [Burkholderiaceae bacterium]|nr:Spy/CpxP family protein refolding chaperone [Burkholderiaceae bacterium]
MSRLPSTRSVLAASALAFGLPFAAYVQAADDSARPEFARAHAMKAGAHGAMHHGGGEHFGGGRAMMRGLDLTEEQRDKLFALRHAQAPEMRAKMKEIRQSRRALRELTMSDQYDEAKAQALADQGAKAMGEVAMLRAKMGNAFYKVLTPAQREKLKQRMAKRGHGGGHFDRHGGPGKGQHGMGDHHGKGRSGMGGPVDAESGRAPRS